ncbi:metallophosphoesterase [Yersinia mollaretii]|uniref:Metallophosphoesterase n=1 Tax=Yersinia mollaretii TaxID=33060 RepID=A0AA44I0A1_YERMO|nr:metallophosphoesterase [Yersinia mollaretii]NIL23458.1 metallophosphoesterase [Yersinia mollaretii]CNJ35118.1 Calcineurin-like phosphoesterase superfamily domain [Yersinia mollaretii]CQR10029.1 Calcineurin-like phosphoesterase superfamily domain [Yersinia mollaretii]
MLLLHLSDIHFRLDEIRTPMDPNRHLRNELVLDAREMCRKLGKSPSAILISGDIAFAGHPEEYKFALTWLETLAQECGTNIECVFVIPGNHDVVRGTAARPIVQMVHNAIKQSPQFARDGQMRSFLMDQETSHPLYSSLDEFNSFAVRFFCDVKAPDRTIATRDLRLNDGSILRLNGLNSALVSSHADKKGDLYVDPACFQIARERGVEHVVLCHHPFTWLGHGEELKSHLNDVARIQLFGHEHSNRIELQDDTVRIAASAAHPDRVEPGWEPGYNLIEVSVGNSLGGERELNIAAHVRIWQTAPGQFRAKMRRQEDVYRKEIPLESWTPATQPVITPISESILPPIISNISGDPMDELRNISIKFHKLTFSQKSAIAGKLGLLEEEDRDQPDFERFRRVFIRARDRGQIEELEKEIRAVS